MQTPGHAHRVSERSQDWTGPQLTYSRKYGDLSTRTPDPPIHQFKLDLSQDQNMKPGHCQREMEFELPERLDLGVSEKGVVGRQVTMREAGGAILGVGIVGYN